MNQTQIEYLQGHALRCGWQLHGKGAEEATANYVRATAPPPITSDWGTTPAAPAPAKENGKGDGEKLHPNGQKLIKVRDIKRVYGQNIAVQLCGKGGKSGVTDDTMVTAAEVESAMKATTEEDNSGWGQPKADDSGWGQNNDSEWGQGGKPGPGQGGDSGGWGQDNATW